MGAVQLLLLQKLGVAETFDSIRTCVVQSLLHKAYCCQEEFAPETRIIRGRAPFGDRLTDSSVRALDGDANHLLQLVKAHQVQRHLQKQQPSPVESSSREHSIIR